MRGEREREREREREEAILFFFSVMYFYKMIWHILIGLFVKISSLIDIYQIDINIRNVLK